MDAPYLSPCATTKPTLVNFRANTIGKGMNPLLLPAIVALLFFYENGFGIK